MGAARVLLEPAFLLRQRDYRDSSRIIEFLGRGHGRVCLFAKGVRRPGSALGAVLQPFAPLLVSWAGPADGGTLTAAEFIGLPPRLPPAAVLSGFYLSELILKLLGRDDPCPEVHDAYAIALAELRSAPDSPRPLRLFEKRLLEALGLGLDYAHLADGTAVRADAYYDVRAEQGVIAAPSADPARGFRGCELVSLAAEELGDAASLMAAKRLLRSALDAALDGRELATRGVARAVRAHAAPGTGRDGEGSAR